MVFIMSYFIATAPIDPAANELRGFVRDTQEEAEEMAAANAKPNLPWTVYELVECAQVVAQGPRLTRIREPAPMPGAAPEAIGSP